MTRTGWRDSQVVTCCMRHGTNQLRSQGAPQQDRPVRPIGDDAHRPTTRGEVSRDVPCLGGILQAEAQSGDTCRPTKNEVGRRPVDDEEQVIDDEEQVIDDAVIVIRSRDAVRPVLVEADIIDMAVDQLERLKGEPAVGAELIRICGPVRDGGTKPKLASVKDLALDDELLTRHAVEAMAQAANSVAAEEPGGVERWHLLRPVGESAPGLASVANATVYSDLTQVRQLPPCRKYATAPAWQPPTT